MFLRVWGGRRDGKSLLTYLLLTEEFKYFSICSKYCGMLLTIVNYFMLILQSAWAAWLKSVVVLLLSWLGGSWNLKYVMPKCTSLLVTRGAFLVPQTNSVVPPLTFWKHKNGWKGLVKTWGSWPRVDNSAMMVPSQCFDFHFPLSYFEHSEYRRILFCDPALHKRLVLHSKCV